MRCLRPCFLSVLLAACMPGANTLDVYVVDVEGGKSMLVVTPSGQAVLVDAGWAGLNNEKWVVTQPDDRDTDRIVEVVKLAKLKQIDYFVVTHYDGDHVGNVPRVVADADGPEYAIRRAVNNGYVVAG